MSIVVPVFNESANLGALWSRLKPVLDGLGRPWETIFVDDGSRDDSLEILREIAAGEDGACAWSNWRAISDSIPRSWRASAVRAATSSSRSTPTCRIRPKKFRG